MSTETTKEELAVTPEEIESNARNLAHMFDQVRGDRQWFKPIHIKREVRGETEATIELKLNMLIELGFAKKRKNDHNQDWKYMITISNDQKLKYLEEYREYLDSETKKTVAEIMDLESK